MINRLKRGKKGNRERENWEEAGSKAIDDRGMD